MSHILEVVVVAFIVGLAGSVAGFLLEKRIRASMAKGKTFQLWTVVGALLGAAVLVVILGSFADSLNFTFSPRIISIQIPYPHAAAGAKPVSVLLLLSLAAAFFLAVRSVDYSFRTDERLREIDPTVGLLNLSKTVAVVSSGITTALMFQYFKSRLYAGWSEYVPIPLPLALAVINYVIGRVAIGIIRRHHTPRLEGAFTVVWSSLSYVILVLAFIR
ncbi:MAG TPA: hypothetical protein VGR47_03765 [Terracidiphilus sp.]|nr:hypothetical protein [Terracidiphilus sp.]